MRENLILSETRPARARNAVVFCCDNNLPDIVAFVIHRLREAETETDYEFCVCTFEEDLALPHALLPDIRVCRIDPAPFAELPTRGALPLTCYICPALPEIFTGDYERIVSLDADILPIGAQMSRLLSTKMHGHPLAAALDLSHWEETVRPDSEEHLRLLGLEGIQTFNSGIVVFDVRACQHRQLFQGVMDFALSHREWLFACDQSALNGYLRGDWRPLSLRWNWQACGLGMKLIDAIEPEIIHFVGGTKPWLGESTPATFSPYREIYEAFFRDVLKKPMDFAPYETGPSSRNQRKPRRTLRRGIAKLLRPHRYRIFRKVVGNRAHLARFDEMERAARRGIPVWPRRLRRAGLLSVQPPGYSS